MNKKLLAILIILTFGFVYYLRYFYGYVVFGKENWNEMSKDLRICIINYTGILIITTVSYLLLKKSPLKTLGLDQGFLNGLTLAFISALPMFIGYGYKVNFHTDITLVHIHRDLVMAGFYEEFVFRGFLFGLLFYYCGWGFIPAVLIPSVFFGLGHLYQADHFADAIGIFIFTALANAGFAWFYFACSSLWFVIFLHGFMDLAWVMFSIESNVTGNLHANIFRFTTLGIAIFFTYRKTLREGRSLKGKVWQNNSNLNA